MAARRAVGEDLGDLKLLLVAGEAQIEGPDMECGSLAR